MKLFDRCPRCNKFSLVKFGYLDIVHKFYKCDCSLIRFNDQYNSFEFGTIKYKVYVNKRDKYSEIYLHNALQYICRLNFIVPLSITDDELDKLLILL
jgi:hypothetical protein